jgi:hypothetical protein
MSAMKDLVLEIVEDYLKAVPADKIMDKLIDKYDMDYDQALDVYESAISLSSDLINVLGA